ncbi:MAG: DNA/RNA-binding winged helix domain-containing protein, partial [Pseudohongiellaceae bacterium]
QVKQDVANLLADTSLRMLPLFSVSAVSGDGVESLLDHLKQLTTLQGLANNDSQHNPRFAIDRSFTVAGLGTVLTGTMASGVLLAGDSLVHSASGKPVRIKRLRHHQIDVSIATKGQRVALNVDLPPQSFSRGEWLLHSAVNLPAFRIDVRLRNQDGVNFRPSSYYHLHLGPAHHIVTVRKTGDSDYFRFHCDEPMFASFGDRLILRDPSATRTLAGGVVIDITVSLQRRNLARRIERLRCLDQADPAALVSLLGSSSAGVDIDQYGAGRNLSESGITALLAAMDLQPAQPVSLSLASQTSKVLLDRNFFDQYRSRTEQLLGDYHQANPYHVGINPAALAAKLKLGEAQVLFPAILQLLLQQGSIRRDGTSISLAGHTVKTDPEQIKFMQGAKPLLIKGGFTAPRTFELAEALHLALVKVEKHLRIARQAGQLIQVAPNRHYLPDTIAALAAFTENLARQVPPEQGFTVQQFRDASSVG